MLCALVSEGKQLFSWKQFVELICRLDGLGNAPKIELNHALEHDLKQ